MKVDKESSRPCLAATTPPINATNNTRCLRVPALPEMPVSNCLKTISTIGRSIIMPKARAIDQSSTFDQIFPAFPSKEVEEESESDVSWLATTDAMQTRDEIYSRGKRDCSLQRERKSSSIATTSSKISAGTVASRIYEYASVATFCQVSSRVSSTSRTSRFHLSRMTSTD